MAAFRLLLDTNVVIDFMSRREPFYDDARLLMVGGRAGEFELWISSTQVTDLVYILSDGGRQSEVPDVLERLRGLRTFVEVYPVGGREVDQMLASRWKDPEDALIYEVALAIRADFIVTRNQVDFEDGLVRAVDCSGFLDHVEFEKGISYREIAGI